MESSATFAAEWFSHAEMIKLQCVSVLMSANLKEWQYKNIMDEDDNQVWDCSTDEWAEYMYGEGNSPAL